MFSIGALAPVHGPEKSGCTEDKSFPDPDIPCFLKVMELYQSYTYTIPDIEVLSWVCVVFHHHHHRRRRRHRHPSFPYAHRVMMAWILLIRLVPVGTTSFSFQLKVLSSKRARFVLA